MARKISEIYDAIALSKSTMSELNSLLVDPSSGTSTLDSSQKLLSDLKSGSRVAIWRLWMWVTAVAIWSLENILDLFRIEIIDLISRKDVGTEKWYQAIALEYQHGDNLQWNGKRFVYPTVDESKKIIKKAVAVTEGGMIRMKITRLSSGVIVPVSSIELTAFTAYIRLRKFAGTLVSIISLDADTLWITCTVVYNATLLDSTGQSLANPGTYPVEDAINAYVAGLNDDFNGKFFNSEVLMAAKQVESVIDVPALTVKQKNVIDGTYVTVNASAIAYSGHFVIDSVHSLRTQITYVANV